MKTQIKDELHEVATYLFAQREFDMANTLIKAFNLIEKLENKLEIIEFRRRFNASQVSKLVAKNKSLIKGMKKIAGHTGPKAKKIKATIGQPIDVSKLQPDTLYSIVFKDSN
jgi:hypothetical protein